MRNNNRFMQLYLKGTATPRTLYVIYEATRTRYRLDGSSEALVRAICSCTPAPARVKGDDLVHDTANLTSLAFLYVELNAKQGMSPEDLYTMYSDALTKLKALYEADRKQR